MISRCWLGVERWFVEQQVLEALHMVCGAPVPKSHLRVLEDGDTQNNVRWGQNNT